MIFDGALADMKVCGDIFTRHALQDERHDLVLTLCQTRNEAQGILLHGVQAVIVLNPNKRLLPLGKQGLRMRQGAP